MRAHEHNIHFFLLLLFALSLLQLNCSQIQFRIDVFSLAIGTRLPDLWMLVFLNTNSNSKKKKKKKDVNRQGM